jgi:hypothetical protein
MDAWMRRVVRFWNSLASLPTGHLFARVARGDCLVGVTTRSPTWAGSVMKALRDIGYPYPIDAHSLHPVDFAAIKALLRARASSMWHGLSSVPLFCPLARAQLCSYHRWFRRPAHLPRQALLFLPTPVSHLRVFFRFRMGVHAFPIDVGRRRGRPRHLQHSDMCGTGAVGDEHQFIFMCPALAPVRERFRPLFASGTRPLRLLIWQQDLRAVVRFVHECFAFRSSLLVAAG